MELSRFRVTGQVEAVLTGQLDGSIVTVPVNRLKMFVGYGIEDDSHAGERLLDSRELAMREFGFRKGAPIAHARQFSAMSLEDLVEIEQAFSLPSIIPPGTLGENLLISGIHNFSALPPGTLLFFQKGDAVRNAVLAVWAQNEPCKAAAQSLQTQFPGIDGIEGQFVRVARDVRGVVGMVYSTGYIERGDTVTAVIPRQQLYVVP